MDATAFETHAFRAFYQTIGTGGERHEDNKQQPIVRVNTCDSSRDIVEIGPQPSKRRLRENSMTRAFRRAVERAVRVFRMAEKQQQQEEESPASSLSLVPSSPASPAAASSRADRDWHGDCWW